MTPPNMQLVLIFLILRLSVILSSHFQASPNQFNVLQESSKSPRGNKNIPAMKRINAMLVSYTISTTGGKAISTMSFDSPSFMKLNDIRIESNLELTFYEKFSNNTFRMNGIQNVLLNCYANAALQILFHMPSLLAIIEAKLKNGEKSTQLVQFFRAFHSQIPESPFKYLTVS